MTVPKHAELIHAFADGKVLQFLSSRSSNWLDYSNTMCPDFSDGVWRIKPNEPKKAVIATFISSRGHIEMCLKGTNAFGDFYTEDGWKHYPELDREVTLPVEE